MNQITANSEQELDLNDRLLKALAASPQTRDAVIELINENGFITLSGEVDNPETRQTVRQIVANEPGVISVVNNLKVARAS
jgi:osmotically-inducible protein OsmY